MVKNWKTENSTLQKEKSRADGGGKEGEEVER